MSRERGEGTNEGIMRKKGRYVCGGKRGMGKDGRRVKWGAEIR